MQETQTTLLTTINIDQRKQKTYASNSLEFLFVNSGVYDVWTKLVRRFSERHDAKSGILQAFANYYGHLYLNLFWMNQNNTQLCFWHHIVLLGYVAEYLKTKYVTILSLQSEPNDKCCTLLRFFYSTLELVHLITVLVRIRQHWELQSKRQPSSMTVKNICLFIQSIVGFQAVIISRNWNFPNVNLKFKEFLIR